MNSSPEPQPHFPPHTAVSMMQPRPNSIFFGRFGLRAGYGIAIVLLVWTVLGVIGVVAAIGAQGRMPELLHAQAYAHAHPDAPKATLHFDFTPGFVSIQDAVTFLGLLGMCWLFSRAERRPLRAYGLGSYRAFDLLPGAVWGLVFLSATVAVLRALHLLVFEGRVLHGAAIFTYGAEWLFAFLLVGLAEEYAFRGYLQYTLMRGVWGLAERISSTNTRAVAFWIAACAFSLLFALAHLRNGGENAFGLAQVFLAGVTFSYALWRTGSLWWGIGFHMAWDWAQSFLFGVADSGNLSIGRLLNTHPQGRPLLSGGADGPEGSLFATVALLLTIAVIRFTTKPGMQPALEPGPKPAFETAPAVLHNPVA